MTKNVLSEKAVLSVLNISTWTARKYDKKVTDDTNKRHAAGGDAGRYNKQLIAKERIEKITKISNTARNLHYHLTQPWLDNGARVLPSALYLDYANKLRELRTEFEVEADDFARDYPDFVKEARKRLNGMFREEDYPSAHLIRGKFNFDLKIMPCPDSGDFRVDIPKAMLKDIQDDVEDRLQGALEGAMRDSRDRIIATVGHMAEKLQAYTPADGDDRAEGLFRDSLVENIRELAAVLPAFNLTNDPKLTKIINRIQKELCAEDADVLRTNEEVRETVQQSAEEILAQVQQYMA